MEQNSNLLFAKKSEKIFTKIEFVNALTPKEISNLNARYMALGLSLKQVVVDNFGNEKEISDKNKNFLGKKRKRKEFNSLNDFLNKYYGDDDSFSLNNHFKKSKKNNLTENKSNQKFTKEELSELKNVLNSLKEDCQKIEYKIDKIEINEFKSKIIDYILKFKKYITKEQYIFLFNKWKNELSQIKGVNLFDLNNNNNLYNWKVSILKAFKSEIILYGICNICDSKITGKKINNENKDEENNYNENQNNEEEEKKCESSESDSGSSENSDEENFFNKNDDLFFKANKENNNDEIL